MKTISAILLSAVACSFLSAEPVKVNDELSYDANNGWWWYQETYKDPESGKEETIKFKMSPEEKAKLDREKDTQKLLKKIVEKTDEQTKVSNEILKRLNYAFPDVTPEFSVNSKTGKKCKTNSSSDCFVMPVTAEGQQVPVLKDFLREPSPSNSKEWLKWQATYFNHVNKVSTGLRFAFLQDGHEAYPTATTFALGDSMINSKSEDMQAVKEAKVLMKHKDNIAYLIFIGQNELYEKLNKIYYRFSSYNSSFMKNMKFAIIYPSEEAKKASEDYIFNTLGKKEGEKTITSFFKTAKSSVRPDLYKNYNIRITPSVVMFYEDKKSNKNIWQVILSGQPTPANIRKTSIDFLTYNGIVKEEEFSADLNWGATEDMVNQKPIANPDFDNIYEDYTTEVK